MRWACIGPDLASRADEIKTGEHLVSGELIIEEGESHHVNAHTRTALDDNHGETPSAGRRWGKRVREGGIGLRRAPYTRRKGPAWRVHWMISKAQDVGRKRTLMHSVGGISL